MTDSIEIIPIEQINILNPRFRDKRRFEKVVQSIRVVGLKKPIKVSPTEGSDKKYDLICGQGRIEAFIILGHKEIPAIVVSASKEDRLLMSLVENMARRYPSPELLIEEIARLKALGYTNTDIGKKLDLQDSFIGGLLVLKNNGEERLLSDTIRGRIPLGIAIEIAKADTIDLQRTLLEAYEGKHLNKTSIRTVKRLIERRRFAGKLLWQRGSSNNAKTMSTEGMIQAVQREGQRQKLMIRKGRLCDAQLTFYIAAFKRLFENEHFVTLLRAERLLTMPKCLADKISFQ